MTTALTFKPVDKRTVEDFSALFEARGGPSYCWCMAWRVTPDEAKTSKGSERKPFILQRIADGVPVGLLAYRDGIAAGWVSVAPRDTYRDIGGPPAEEGDVIWSIACFYVPRARRGEGLAPQLLDAAVAHAREHGATIVEAYGVDPDSPSYRYMGFVPFYEARDFVEVGRVGKRRHVMRLTVSSRSSGSR